MQWRHQVSDRLVDDEHSPRGVRSGKMPNTLQTSKHFTRTKLAMFDEKIFLWTGNLQPLNSHERENSPLCALTFLRSRQRVGSSRTTSSEFVEHGWFQYEYTNRLGSLTWCASTASRSVHGRHLAVEFSKEQRSEASLRGQAPRRSRLGVRHRDHPRSSPCHH